MTLEIAVDLPEFHPGQLRAWEARGRFTAVRCGRRWGKTQLAIAIAGRRAIDGQYWGIFAPDYKIMSETYRDIEYALRPVIENSNKTDGIIRLLGGGRIDFWTLNNPKAGRSRKYHGVVIDEAAFTGPEMMDTWLKSIQPTLLDFSGVAWALSTPNGKDEDNFFYRVCTDKTSGFVEFHAPTRDNPYMSDEELGRIEKSSMPLVWNQEYLAEFVDWSGESFFSPDSLLVDNQPVDVNWRTDQIFATVDTASKDGAEHDGTSAIIWARSKHAGVPLVILDYDIVQIESDLLIHWLPGIEKRLEELARETNARQGSLGIWIEDRDSGIGLIQSSKRQGLNIHAIDTRLTAMGKEGRAIAASPYVYQGMVKFSRYAFDKNDVEYRKTRKNHLVSQLADFRMGSAKKLTHRLDLVDCFTYGVSISLGNSAGW